MAGTTALSAALTFLRASSSNRLSRGQSLPLIPSSRSPAPHRERPHSRTSGKRVPPPGQICPSRPAPFPDKRSNKNSRLHVTGKTRLGSAPFRAVQDDQERAPV